MGLKKSYLRKMSLELGFEANVEIDANVEVEVDIEPEVEVEVEIEAPEIEVEIEAEVDAEIEVEVEVPQVEVEVEAGGDLVVESNLAEPIVDVEVGGNAGAKSSGGVCNLICSILFLVFFIGDIITLCCLAFQWNYYTTTMVQTYGYNQTQANTAMIIAIVGVSIGAALWGILACCCMKCWKNSRGQGATTVVVEQTTYGVGGGVDAEVEVEIEMPQVEVEVEVEAPEVEVEVEVEVDVQPEVEVEVEVEGGIG